MSSHPNFTLPTVPCPQPNHQKHRFEYICLNKTCIQHKQNPLCFYCLKQSHQSHQAQTLSLNEFVSQCLEISSSKTKEFREMTNEQHIQFYQLEDMLINGLRKCETKVELAAMLEQIYKATYLAARFSDYKEKRMQNVLNHEIRQISKETHNFYEKNQGKNTLITDSTSKQSRSLTSDTQFNIPILTFSNSLPTSQNFTQISPFQITHTKSNNISSITAHPSLSTYSQSVEVFIKVNKLTPNWMGIGVSLGEHKYEQKSKNHITLLSNGWLNERGQIKKNQLMRYEAGHVVRVQWNKDKKLLIFRNLNTKNEEIIKFEPQWNEDVYICSTMFFKNDSLSIIQSGQI